MAGISSRRSIVERRRSPGLLSPHRDRPKVPPARAGWQSRRPSGEPIMRHLFAVSAAALLWSAASAFAADPVGSYSVQGSNPGNRGNYSGTVTVEKTGETYRVIWVVAGAMSAPVS